jgi:hypothetical protein
MRISQNLGMLGDQQLNVYYMKFKIVGRAKTNVNIVVTWID